MTNIKQKSIKLIISFICLFSIAGCDSLKNFSSSNNDENIVEVAILLPFSGNDAIEAKQYAQMIKMGLADGAKSRIRVSSYDSTTEELLQVSLDKIFSAGTDIIIGPLYSSNAKIVTNSTRKKGAIIITLSNDPVLAEKNTFVLGHAPMRQLERITNYFLDHEYKNYIALLPAGRHSQTVGKILQSMIASRNGTLARIELYNNNPEDMEKSVHIVSDSVDNLNEMDFNLTQPVILLGDDQQTLQALFDNISKYHLDAKSVIAGDNRIDINSRMPIDITFTGSLNMINSDIIARAKQQGIKHLSFMHAISYDAGKMTANYINKDYHKTRFLAQMNSLQPFTGTSGNITFVDSIAQRKYDVIRKENGNYNAVTEDNHQTDNPELTNAP